MQRVLFICGNYDPYPSANGVCVLRLQESLLARGIESDVICMGETDDVTQSKYGSVYHLHVPPLQNGFFRKIIRFFIWPLKDIRVLKGYRKRIQQASAERNYLCLIGVLRPIEGVLACAACGNYVIYECDSISNNGDNAYGIKRLLRWRADLLEAKMYRKAKHIFHMVCHSDFYSQKKYEKYRDKSELIDIPQLVDEGIADKAANHDEPIQILYSGTLSEDTRSPVYSIRLIDALAKQFDRRVELNFYSRGNCEGLLEKAERETKGVIQKRGYVSLGVLNEAVANADFMLSIGNCLTGTVTSLPSKVISYMAYGKPIIHIDGGRNDVAKAYLEQYPLTLIIHPEEDLQKNVELVSAFIRNNRGARVPFERVKERFAQNTPEYTVMKLMRVLGEDGENASDEL